MNHSSALAFCEKFAAGNHTPAEHAEFIVWLHATPESEIGEMMDLFRRIAASPQSPETADPLLVSRIESALDLASDPGRGRVVRLLRRYGVAAAVLLILAGTGWWIVRKRGAGEAPVARHAAPVNDIQPGGDKAVLTLADGSKVVLEDAQNGQVAQQGGATVIKINGQLSYNGADVSGATVYNTMNTPRGGQYRLILADSTVVWLNSASSLRFPTNFSGPVREVELSGEGYFEVAKNARKPFRVKTGDQYVNVLGTDFNIMAYPEEAAIRTTLVSGSVRVQKGNVQALLEPGKQSVLYPNAQQIETVTADMETDLAWKNGRFEFEETDIKKIMRQLERWYAIRVAYQGDVSRIVLSGSVSRRKTVGALLDILAQTGRFHFRIEDDLITISQ